MVIRQQQLDNFILSDENKFVRSLMQHIREENPERVPGYPDNLLEEMVRVGIKRAKSHGFKQAENLSAFVVVMFEVAPNFDEQTEIKKFLNDRRTPVEQRLDRTIERASSEAWEEAADIYDAEAWFPKQDNNTSDGVSLDNA